MCKILKEVLTVAVLFVGLMAYGGTVQATPPIDVFVGYADNLNTRTAALFFPNPWAGSPNTVFVGSASGFVDAGAIRIDNKSGAPLTIDSVSVCLHGPGCTVPFGNPTGPVNLWGSQTIPAGFSLILTQTIPLTLTTQPNFDTSDNPIVGCCTPVAKGTQPFPKIFITIGGVTTEFDDTAHTLDTGGFDLAQILVNGVNLNESLQWRPIGTCGIDCPAGGSALSNTPLQSDSAGPSCWTDFYGFATQVTTPSFSFPSGLTGTVKSSVHPRSSGGFGYTYQIAMTGGSGSVMSLNVPFAASIANVFGSSTSVRIVGCSEQPGACFSPNPANDLDDLGFAGSPSPLSVVYSSVGTATPTSSSVTALSGGTYTTGFSGISAGQTSRIFAVATTQTTTTTTPGFCGATLTDASGATTSVQVICPGGATISTATISTVAGTGTAGFNGNNQAATAAQLNDPIGVGVGAGSLFIADKINHRIRKVSGGTITTVAGTGTAGFSGDGGLATNAQLDNPYGVAVDGAGNLFIADGGNQVIRRVDATTGFITTLAGTPRTAGFSGDGGPAINAQLKTPTGVAVGPTGDLFVADFNNHRIRRVFLDIDGIIKITTVAGTGFFGFSGDGGQAINAQLWHPKGVAVDSSGNLYIADSLNQRIRKVSGGTITTVAGTGTAGFNGDNIAATSAPLNAPLGVAVDSSGNFFIADEQNSRIRKVSSGIITTVAGTGTPGFSGDGGQAIAAQLRSPSGVAVDGSVFFIADISNQRIRRVGP